MPMRDGWDVSKLYELKAMLSKLRWYSVFGSIPGVTGDIILRKPSFYLRYLSCKPFLSDEMFVYLRLFRFLEQLDNEGNYWKKMKKGKKTCLGSFSDRKISNQFLMTERWFFSWIFSLWVSLKATFWKLSRLISNSDVNWSDFKLRL